MASDMVVALAGATMDGQTLFGHNFNDAKSKPPRLLRAPGQQFTTGETLRLGALQLPQVRSTASILASRADAEWGYRHGVSENGVAIGVTSVRTRLNGSNEGLSGSALVRLALERSRSARQAIDLITDLVSRHGHSEAGSGSALMIADRHEAYNLIAADRHWVWQAVGSVRAVGEICQIRKDWDRISPGLSDLAISRGWWPEDGSKLDFAGSICLEVPNSAPSVRRWGQLTRHLEGQTERINIGYLRSLLGKHAVVGLEARDEDPIVTTASLIARLDSASDLPQVWYSFGSPALGLYFPLTFDVALPEAFSPDAPADLSVRRGMSQLTEVSTRGVWQAQAACEALIDLQVRFDQMEAEYHLEARQLRKRGQTSELDRLAESFLLNNLEQWFEVSTGLLGDLPTPVADEAALSIR